MRRKAGVSTGAREAREVSWPPSRATSQPCSAGRISDSLTKAPLHASLKKACFRPEPWPLWLSAALGSRPFPQRFPPDLANRNGTFPIPRRPFPRNALNALPPAQPPRCSTGHVLSHATEKRFPGRRGAFLQERCPKSSPAAQPPPARTRQATTAMPPGRGGMAGNAPWQRHPASRGMRCRGAGTRRHN